MVIPGPAKSPGDCLVQNHSHAVVAQAVKRFITRLGSYQVHYLPMHCPFVRDYDGPIQPLHRSQHPCCSPELSAGTVHLTRRHPPHFSWPGTTFGRR